MSNHFLNEAFEQMSRGEPAEHTILLNEAPNQNQIWVERHLIKPITQLIANLHGSRSYVSGYITREQAMKDTQELEAIKNRFLEMWHDIEDNKQPGDEPAVAPNVVDLEKMLKKLKAVKNPHFKGTRRAAKFPTPDAVKQFVEYAKQHGLDPISTGNVVSYNIQHQIVG